MGGIVVPKALNFGGIVIINRLFYGLLFCCLLPAFLLGFEDWRSVLREEQFHYALAPSGLDPISLFRYRGVESGSSGEIFVRVEHYKLMRTSDDVNFNPSEDVDQVAYPRGHLARLRTVSKDPSLNAFSSELEDGSQYFLIPFQDYYDCSQFRPARREKTEEGWLFFLHPKQKGRKDHIAEAVDLSSWEIIYDDSITEWLDDDPARCRMQQRPASTEEIEERILEKQRLYEIYLEVLVHLEQSLNSSEGASSVEGRQKLFVKHLQTVFSESIASDIISILSLYGEFRGAEHRRASHLYGLLRLFKNRMDDSRFNQNPMNSEFQQGPEGWLKTFPAKMMITSYALHSWHPENPNFDDIIFFDTQAHDLLDIVDFYAAYEAGLIFPVDSESKSFKELTNFDSPHLYGTDRSAPFAGWREISREELGVLRFDRVDIHGEPAEDFPRSEFFRGFAEDFRP